MERGMTGATGNYYCGLHEFEDMAFILNLLRPNDLFVDIGANIGSYTVLASGASKAQTIAVEPLLATFNRLRANVRYNNLDGLVQLYNLGIGDSDTPLRFTSTLDTVNHVATANDADAELVEVPAVSLDQLMCERSPLCLKIDVEGFEKKVIDGGENTLKKPSLRAVVMELNGSGRHYGYNDTEVHQSIIALGFTPYSYDPFERKLNPMDDRNRASGNTLYLRDIEFIHQRVETAPDIVLPWRRIAAPS